MSRTNRRRVPIAVAAALTGVMLVSGCASGASSAGGVEESGAAGIIGAQSDGGEPVDGGVFTYASYSPATSLDPVAGRPVGFLGGTEMAAVYDVLMRYDIERDSYEPQLAQSLAESEDHLAWTLKLRPGVVFSDGTPFDAAAVVAATNRFTEGGGTGSEIFVSTVKAAEAVDDLTVSYVLNRPWAEFPSALAGGYGMIPAPSSYVGEKFTPVGAGAFTVEKFAPGSEVIFTAREDYWGGKPHIDQLKFVDIVGEQPRIDALKTGGVQMTFLRESNTIEIAKEQFPGYLEPTSVADAGQINSREGRPGSDVRVRKAMAMAINPEVINQRSRSGKNKAGSDIFQSWSKWSGDVRGIAYDPDTARKLLDEAKADGYDGRLTFVTPQIPASQDMALASQSMLQNVGFNVEIKYISSVPDLVKTLFVTHDFDVSSGGWGLLDATPFSQLYTALASSSKSNVGGGQNAVLDEILTRIQIATSDDAKRAALQDLQSEVNASVPFLAWGAGWNFVPWAENVHGIIPSSTGLTLLDEAWISK